MVLLEKEEGGCGVFIERMALAVGWLK